MSKQALGRGLGTLLGGKPQQGKPPHAFSPPAPLSVGVRSLMRGSNAPSAAPSPASAPRWYLFAGDVLLIATALLIVAKSPHPLSWQRDVLCAFLVLLAAGLAVLAIWKRE